MTVSIDFISNTDLIFTHLYSSHLRRPRFARPPQEPDFSRLEELPAAISAVLRRVTCFRPSSTSPALKDLQDRLGQTSEPDLPPHILRFDTRLNFWGLYQGPTFNRQLRQPNANDYRNLIPCSGRPDNKN